MKDNKVSLEGNDAIAKMAFEGDAAKIQMASEMANECAGTTDADRCEASSQILQCFMKAGNARGVNFGDW